MTTAKIDADDANFAAIDAQSLKRALDFERRRSQGLEAEVSALKVQLLDSADLAMKESETVSTVRALGSMRDAIAMTKFNTLRTVVPIHESFTGSRNVHIPWSEITPRSVIHISACEAAQLPDTAPEKQIGVPGDAPIAVRNAVCGNGVVVANIHVDWPNPLPLLISVTHLSHSAQFVFCNVELQQTILETPELESLIQAQVCNLSEIAIGNDITDDDFVEWAYRKILGRSPDIDGKSNWIETLRMGDTTRAEMVINFLKSEEYAIRIRQ